MKKTIICVLASIVLVIVTAGFLYDSGVLFFRYGDTKQGILHLAAAVSFGIFYVWCASKIGKKEQETTEDMQDLWKKEQKKEGFSIVLTGICETGIALYLCRFSNQRELLVLALLCAGVTCVITVVFVLRTCFGGKMAECAYRECLLGMTKQLEMKGCIEYSDQTKNFALEMVKGKMKAFGTLFCVGNVWIAAMFVACEKIGVGGYLLPVFSAGVLLLLGIKGLSFTNTSRKLMIALNDRQSGTVLGALILYYESAGKKFQTLAHTVQSYAVAALCDQEMYEEALALITTIRRPLKWESYYMQWQMICLEGLKDRQGMTKLLESRTIVSAKRKSGGNDGWDVFEAAKALADKDYEKVIELVKEHPGSNERIARSRERFAKDAKEKIFGEKE